METTLNGEKKKINTSKLGKQLITINVKNKFGKVKKFNYSIIIVDTKKPIIRYNKKISISIGEKIDLLKDVKVKDNSKEKINVKIDGKYDLNKEPEPYSEHFYCQLCDVRFEKYKEHIESQIHQHKVKEN